MRKTPVHENFCCCFDFKKCLTCYAIVNLVICLFIIWTMRFMLYQERYTDVLETTVLFTAPIDTVFTVILVIATYKKLPWLLKVVATYNLLWVLLHLGLVIFIISQLAPYAGFGRNALPVYILLVLYLFLPVLWILYRAYIFMAIISFTKKVEQEDDRKADNIHVEAV